jgi:hypothetical protein
VNAQGDIVVTDGQLELHVNDKGGYSEIRSFGLFDFRDRWVEFELAEDVPEGASVWFTVGSWYGDYVELYKVGDQLRWFLEDGGTGSNAASIPFDFAKHQRTRIRHDSSAPPMQRIVGEAWIDDAWQPIPDFSYGNGTKNFDPRYARVFVGAQYETAVPTAPVRVAGVRAIQPETPLCPAASLTDTFETAEEPWDIWEETLGVPCPIDQEPAATFTCASPHFNMLRSHELFDAAGGQVSVDVTSLPDNGYAALQLSIPATPDDWNEPRVSVRLDRLQMRVQLLSFVNGVEEEMDSEDVTGIVTTLALEGLPNGEVAAKFVDNGAVRTLAGIAPFDLSRVHARIEAGTTNSGGTIVLDNFNLGALP